MSDPSAAASAAAAIPWGTIATSAAAAVISLVGGVAALIHLVVKQQREIARLYKGKFKHVVKDRAELRREVEQERYGTASIPPVSDDEMDDNTQRIEVLDERDDGWRPQRIRPGLPERPPLEAFRDARSPEERRRSGMDRTLRKFTSEGESTPPDPHSPAYRKKLPSRRG